MSCIVCETVQGKPRMYKGLPLPLVRLISEVKGCDGEVYFTEEGNDILIPQVLLPISKQQMRDLSGPSPDILQVREPLIHTIRHYFELPRYPQGTDPDDFPVTPPSDPEARYIISIVLPIPKKLIIAMDEEQLWSELSSSYEEAFVLQYRATQLAMTPGMRID